MFVCVKFQLTDAERKSILLIKNMEGNFMSKILKILSGIYLIMNILFLAPMVLAYLKIKGTIEVLNSRPYEDTHPVYWLAAEFYSFTKMPAIHWGLVLLLVFMYMKDFLKQNSWMVMILFLCLAAVNVYFNWMFFEQHIYI